MRRAIRQNLEFLTDQQVLDKGIDKQTYQYSLLNVSKKGTSVGLSNQFNFKLLKRRIMMMNKKRSSKIELSKYAFLLPVFLLAGAAFTVSKAEGSIEGVVEKANETTVIQLNKDSQVDVSLPEKKVSRESKPLVKNLPSREMSVDTLIAKSPADTLHFRANMRFEKEPLYIVEGKVVNSTIMAAIPGAEIQSIDVIKDKAATIYGEKGKNGVVLVTLKKNGSLVTANQTLTFTYDKKDNVGNAPKMKMKGEPSEVVVTGYKSGDASEPKLEGMVQGVVVNMTGRTELEAGKFGARGIKGDPLFVIDGKIVADYSKIKEIDPNTIGHMTVLKGQSATALYGNQGMDGVIVIATKAYGKEHPEALSSDLEDRLSGKVKKVIKTELGKEKGEVLKKEQGQ
jgi:TonB-dependent SusC/RagA subfamily outer membrane receptor